MATTSFTLKQTLSTGGSGLQRTYAAYTSGPSVGASYAVVEDSALKSDDYIPVSAVVSAGLTYTFTAEVFTRTEIELSWQLGALLTTATGSSYVPVEMLIVASSEGDPITPLDGREIVTVTAANFRESLVDSQQPYIKEGNWVYYSMFIKYANTTDSYYDRVAVVSVQIPRNFNSTEDLWNHIPEYYRSLDENYVRNTPNYAYSRGPLYRMVDLFGWELDKIRTLIYDTMRINDPDVVHNSAIDALAKQTGIELSKDAVGSAKLRTILRNIGYLQRTKGTLDSIEAYITSISACNLTTNTSTSPIQFNVHPQRVNLVTDPFFKQAATTTDTTGPVYRTYAALSSGSRTHGWGVYVNAPTVTPTIDVNNGQVTITFPTGAGTNDVYIYSRGSFSYNNNLTYYGSAVSSHDFALRFITATNMTSGLESAETVTFYDSWNNGASAFPRFSSPTRKIVGSIPNTSTVTPASVVPVFYFSVVGNASASTTVTFSAPMVEPRNSSGDFFTGDSTKGGFIPTSTNVSLGASDFRWGPNDGSGPNTDFSYYTSDNKRSRTVAEYIVENYVAPVTFVRNQHYVINWDVLE